MVIMMYKVKKFITACVVGYFLLTLLYLLFIILFVYFNNITKNYSMTYTIVASIFILLNINVMSIIFIIKFNKILHRIDDLIYTLGYEK